MPGKPMSEIYISDIVAESDLVHYGVKGMHWGIRKDPGASSGKSSTTSIKDLADSDLQKVVNRMRLEQQYKDLTANPALKTGKKHVAKYANQTLNLVITTALTATIGAAVKQHFANGGGIPSFGFGRTSTPTYTPTPFSFPALGPGVSPNYPIARPRGIY